MQPKPDKCPVCAEALRPHLAKRRVTIFECATCDHRVAVHADAAVAGEGDYHAQYDQGAFLSSLERTRQRQARLFIPRIRQLAGEDAAILDYGSGRGWFLFACRDAGFKKIAGADTSAMAMRILSENGIPGVLLPGPLTALPFRPTVVTFLDVIEHFPRAMLRETIEQIVSSIGDLRPSSSSSRCRTPPGSSTARLRRSRVRASKGRSSRCTKSGRRRRTTITSAAARWGRLVKSLEWQLVDTARDLDFEPSRMYQRIHSMSPVPPAAVGALPGIGAGLLARSFAMLDSSIYFLRP